MIESVASWFTPTLLFCFLNLMIGTIFITSTLKTDKKLTTTTTPSLLHRVKSFNYPFSSVTHENSHSPQLNRSPSLLQSIKSINLSFSRSDPIPQYDDDQVDDIHEPAEIAADDQKDDAGSHVTRSKSATCPEAKRMILMKSASEKKMMPVTEVDLRRPATTRETVSFGEDEAVDKKADDFINKFRQQLKLQRLDSILRYKEMLNRGVAR